MNQTTSASHRLLSPPNIRLAGRERIERVVCGGVDTRSKALVNTRASKLIQRRNGPLDFVRCASKGCGKGCIKGWRGEIDGCSFLRSFLKGAGKGGGMDRCNLLSMLRKGAGKKM